MYFSVEFAGENGNVIDKMELAMRRDDKILRFLTVALDKFAVKYNEDRRAGKIGKKNREAIASKKRRDEEDLEEVEEIAIAG